VSLPSFKKPIILPTTTDDILAVELMDWSKDGADWMVDDGGPRFFVRAVSRWMPRTNRDDLQEAAYMLKPSDWADVLEMLNRVYFTTNTDSLGHGFVWWLFTCDTSIIADAVAKVALKVLLDRCDRHGTEVSNRAEVLSILAAAGQRSEA